MQFISLQVGTVCDDYFDGVAADVVCREMGFVGASGWSYGENWVVQSSYPIVLDDVVCSDPNSGISSCSFITSHNCGHVEDVFLSCTHIGI